MNYANKVNERMRKLYLMALFILLIIWSIRESIDSVPDEHMKFDICYYIFHNGALPNGGDEAIRNPVWGISYGFTPILAYMISACFMKVMAIFSTSLEALYFAARLTSIFCGTAMAFVVMKISDRLFNEWRYRWTFTLSITLLPQVVFLGSYINNDSLALLSISMIIYAWICGLQDGWTTKHCVWLGISIGICALSYYNAYGYILTSIFLFFISARKQSIFVENKAKILKMALLITVIALVIAGWWFIRSAILYDGDFLGLSTSDAYAQKYAEYGYRPSDIDNPFNTGESLLHMLFVRSWIVSTAVSFIATFGLLNTRLPFHLYIPYLIIILVGVIGLIDRKHTQKMTKIWNKPQAATVLETVFVANIIISVMLGVYYSYTNDYQPQGRYVMPLVFPLFYFLSRGLCAMIEKCKNENVRAAIYLAFFAFYMIVPVYSLKLIMPI
jgi:hypothetical protein